MKKLSALNFLKLTMICSSTLKVGTKNWLAKHFISICIKLIHVLGYFTFRLNMVEIGTVLLTDTFDILLISVSMRTRGQEKHGADGVTKILFIHNLYMVNNRRQYMA